MKQNRRQKNAGFFFKYTQHLLGLKTTQIDPDISEWLKIYAVLYKCKKKIQNTKSI